MGAPSNRTASLESQMIPMIQDVPGQTLRHEHQDDCVALAHAPGFSSLFDDYRLTENLRHYRGDIALTFTTTTRIAGLTSAKLTIERRMLVSDLVFIGLVIRLI